MGVDGVDCGGPRHGGVDVLLQVECGRDGERDLGAVEDIWDDSEVSVCLTQWLIDIIAINIVKPDGELAYGKLISYELDVDEVHAEYICHDNDGVVRVAIVWISKI